MMHYIHRLLHLIILLFYSLWIPLLSHTQTIREICNKPEISLRGLSVVNDSVFWVSGSKGTVGRSTNGGKLIEWIQVPDHTKRDFRDIEAFDDNTAIVMAIDTPAVILKTNDGGKNWKKVFEDKRADMFLDAIYFSDHKNGIVVGDPVDNHFFMATTKDGGEYWKVLSKNKTALAEKGEALFAASGSNIVLIKLQPYFISGGIKTNLIQGHRKILLPLIMNKSSAGANSLAMAEDGRIIIVGGDYLTDTISTGNCIISDDYGKHFIQPQTNPFGYKSCVAYAGNRNWISCGTSGIDISNDHGIHWTHISDQSFYNVQKARKGNRIYLTGSNGRIAELNQSSY
jgi:hypothetical protein